VVGVDARRPGFLKRIELKLGILIGGADSRIPTRRPGGGSKDTWILTADDVRAS
jgi:hypothetical protein